MTRARAAAPPERTTIARIAVTVTYVLVAVGVALGVAALALTGVILASIPIP
jgi:hypothetical protein